MGVLTSATFLAVCLAVVAAVPTRQSRVVGGSETTITQYPHSAALLHSGDFINYQQKCGGFIANNRAVVTSASCVIGDAPIRWRIRVGSNYANFGGTVFNSNLIIINPGFNTQTLDSDIAVIRIVSAFAFGNNIRAAGIAGANFNLLDNSVIWAIGWGATQFNGPHSETLRNVQVWVVNQGVCRSRYAELEYTVTDNMFCSGWLDVGGRDQCTGDTGSPLMSGTTVVGIRSWGMRCGLARYPGVATRISRFTAWINSNV